MILAALCYAPLPLFVWVGVQGMSPWLFTAVWYLTFVAMQTVIAERRRVTSASNRATCSNLPSQSRGRRRSSLRERLRRLRIIDDFRAAKSRYVVMVTLFKLEWPLFAAALAFVDPTVVTVVFEMWPVWFGLICLRRRSAGSVGTEPGSRLEPNEASVSGRHGALQVLLMLVIGAIAVSFAVLSDEGSLALSWASGSALGLLIAVTAAVFAAGATAAQQQMGEDQRGESGDRDKTAVSMAGTAAAQAALALVLAVVGLATARDVSLLTIRGLSFAALCAAAQVAGLWCQQRSLHSARASESHDDASVISLFYLVPVAALALLVGFADTHIARPDMLVVGAAGVVALNMVMHLDPEGANTRQRGGGHGYKASVLALWGAGATVLFRDEWLPANWRVWSVVEYWGLVGVLVTIFVLIWSFRQSRLFDRRQKMDSMMLRLHRHMEMLGRRGLMSTGDADQCARHLRVIDSERNPNRFNHAYFELRKYLARQAAAADAAGDEIWTSLLTGVEEFTNLRQQDRNFAETAMLTAFAALTCAVAVFARPVDTLAPFGRWAHDSASTIIAAAFLFLAFDLVDKRSELDAPTLREVGESAPAKHGKPPDWRLELNTYGSQRFQRATAAALGGAMLIGAVAMLGVKWM